MLKSDKDRAPIEAPRRTGAKWRRAAMRSIRQLLDRTFPRLLGLTDATKDAGPDPHALRRQARRLTKAGLVAPRWYRRTYPESRGSGRRAAEDYLVRGVVEGRDPNPTFDTRRYLALHPEAGQDGRNPLIHFLDRVEQMDAAAPQVICGAIDNLPASIRTGLGTALFLKGWCYPARGRIRFLDLLVGDVRHAIVDHSQPRPDILEARIDDDPGGQSFFSGFDVVVPFPPAAIAGDLDLRLRVVTEDGDVLDHAVGTLTILPGTGATPLDVVWPGAGPRVAICMATHHPPLDLFAAQVASIKAQTHDNWICIVSDDHSPDFLLRPMEALLDDPRFILRKHPAQLNFYGNFERALQLCPADADVVALSDQDDRWYPEKLKTLLDHLDGDAQLVSSDVRIVDRDGTTRSDTFWVSRRNNVTSLASLMAANTVMGAASLFRASLLRQILPFPERLGAAYHDHWIALNALVAGAIRYVDTPLHDYVQHGDNVIGHKNDADAPGLFAAGQALATALLRRESVGHTVRDMLVRAIDDRQSLVAQKVVLARVLLARHPTLRAKARGVLQRFSRLDRLGTALRERVMSTVERRPTLNHEGHFLRAVLISRTRHAIYRTRHRAQSLKIARLRLEHASLHLMAENSRDASLKFTPPAGGRDLPAMSFGHVGWIFHNVSPLRLRATPVQPRRVNLLLATINFDLIFGGYIGMFNFALRLRRDGHAVRIVLLDRTEVELSTWRMKIARYPGLGHFFDEVEIAYRYDRSVRLDVSPRDTFVATSGWSAHVAHQAVRDLGHERFLFLIQEYEPFFGAMNTNAALLRQAYDFPQFGLFSTEILRDYFKINQIGLFEEPDGETRSAVFSNAIQRFSPDRARMLRPSRKILFYARPEDHAARNMFEMGIAALVALFADPAIAAAGWTAHGIGSVDVRDRLELAPGQFLRMVPKTNLRDYTAMLPGFDVGLSLMLTPHPSLVPLEMAAAGLSTVTNTFANKTPERLLAISSNLIGVKPTLDGIVGGLRTAIARTADIDGRLAGARMSWPTDWDAAFSTDTMTRVNAFLNQEALEGGSGASMGLGSDARPTLRDVGERDTTAF